MVFSNIYKILDCGEKKSTPEINMTKKGLELYHRYKWEENLMEQIGFKYERNKELYFQYKKDKDEYENSHQYIDGSIYPNIKNEAVFLKGPPAKPELADIDDENFEKFQNWDWLGRQPYTPAMDDMLYKYFNIQPFEPWVMLNISPDWAGKKITRANICKLKKIFNSYMKEEWYSEWKFVLEAGGNGDHLHLHALCKLGSETKKRKSTHSHIAKSNWKNQILKYAKAEGLEGTIKKPGMQCILIQGDNGDEILADKELYLVEETKPAGHKNKTPKTLENVLGVINRGNL